MKKTSTILLLLLCGLFFSGCFDPIFFEIRNDVEPEEATVSGVIQQIVRFSSGEKEYLLCIADQGLVYKDASDENHGSWNSFSLPFDRLTFDYYGNGFSGEMPIALAANESNIYLASLEMTYNSDSGTNDPSKLIVRTTSSINGSWTEVYSDTSECFSTNSYYGYKNIDFNLFCTNSPAKNHRFAYMRVNSDTLYKLTSSSKEKVESGNTCQDTKATQNWNSAVFYKDSDSVLFFNTTAVATNETSSKSPTVVYYGDDEDLYYSTSLESPAFAKILDAGSTIRSLAYTSDALLIGRGSTTTGYGGITKVSLNASGVPSSSLSSFSTNASYQLSSSYLVLALLNATPQKSETSSILYGSTSVATAGTSSNVSYKNVGLWSYYPSRGNWNRE